MDINAFVSNLPGIRLGGIAIHNVFLINVENGTDEHNGLEVLIVEHDGQRQELKGPNLTRHDQLLVGKVGYLKPGYSIINEIPTIIFHFYDYIDQSLRRVPELDLNYMPSDNDGRKENVVGWTCSMKPSGFLAPIGIIPGDAGSFMSDDTEAVTIRIPQEFFRACRRFKSTPKDVLSDFVADIIGAQNYIAYPRADGYQSNGSDERDYAESWMSRVYGHEEVDLDAIEEEDFQKESLRDELLSLLDEHIENGGDANEFITKVQGLVDNKT